VSFSFSNHFDNNANLLRSIGDGVVMGFFGAFSWLEKKKAMCTAFIMCIVIGWGIVAASEIHLHIRRAGQQTVAYHAPHSPSVSSSKSITLISTLTKLLHR
jgi:uncharacterized protein (DUF486 family)